MLCGFRFSKSGMLFVIIGLWFFCGLFFRFYNFKLEKFKCQTYTIHVRPCGLRGLCGLRGMLLSHTLFKDSLNNQETTSFLQMEKLAYEKVFFFSGYYYFYFLLVLCRQSIYYNFFRKHCAVVHNIRYIGMGRLKSIFPPWS